MEKKKKRRRIWGLSMGDVVKFISLLITVGGAIVWSTLHLERRFEGIDRRFESIDRRLDGIETELKEVKVELRQTSDLINIYLTLTLNGNNDPK